MKKALLLLYIIAAGLLLSGCKGDLFSSRRDMERLRPVQTLGLDREGTGITLSLSTGAGPDGAPALVMSAGGSGIEPAITALQDYSPEDELFYAHVRYILLGSKMVENGSILSLLDWVERSPSMRMDTPLLLVKGSASEAVTGASGEMTDATRRLASLEREELSRGRHLYTLREVASSLLERGGALCLGVESVPSEAVIHTPGEGGGALVPVGYAVLRPDSAALWLTEEESLGAELLQTGMAGAHISLEGCTLEILRGSAGLRGQWDDNGLAGLTVSCDLTAGILERPENAPDTDSLEAALEEAAQSWVLDVIRRSQSLNCDFLDLRGAATGGAFLRGGEVSREWASIFPDLPVTVTAEARIDRGYDLSDD